MAMVEEAARLRALDHPDRWPALRLDEWNETRATLHMWMQMAGKVALELTPVVNHYWNVTFQVTARGLSTAMIPYDSRSFGLRFDFLDHRLVLEVSDGTVRSLPLAARPVADFYGEFMVMLRAAGIEIEIWRMPVEIPDPIPFDEDRVHASYDAGAAQRFWRVLLSASAVLQEFRARYLGKCSPVHFFWGSCDLAVSRFSGRRAPERPGADAMTRESYSHEVSSIGFWPGGGAVTDAAFYSYTAPEPEGFKEARVKPAGAAYSRELGEFILPYEEVRRSESPSATLLEFCQSTYEAGARLGKWDRAALER
jgi:hypothetical protein